MGAGCCSKAVDIKSQVRPKEDDFTPIQLQENDQAHAIKSRSGSVKSKLSSRSVEPES